MRSNKLNAEQKQTLRETDLVIGKWFKEQRIKNWKKLGFSEPMSAQAMGEWYGFAPPRAARRVFDIENGKNIPPRKTLNRMCMMLGFIPQAMYHTGPYKRYIQEQLAHAQALQESFNMHERNQAALNKHIAYMERDTVKEESTADKAKVSEEYA